MDYSVPLIGCHCIECDKIRADKAQAERPRTYSFPVPIGNPFSQAIGDLYDSLSNAPAVVPFGPAQPEPVYTYVLVDYDEDGSPNDSYAELHTAESLVEAIALRSDQDERFVVYRLGESILDVGK